MEQYNRIFALDIGTRSVVGVILETRENSHHVLDMVIKEHDERSMLDGQIHDIVSVAEIIKQIKDELEIKYGPLKKVCVAAAGRALRTETAKAAIDITGKPMLTKEDIMHLELSAVQEAQSKAAEKQQLDKHYHYYCVGYSVLFYKLDGEEIGSLIDQQGKEAAADIIATFLPRVVVESLIAALYRAGLEIEALTLEPIAAIQVLIPPSMRRLNVALVDIGAGTSDIAITDMGTVISYGMVPVAGDEITEALSDQYLLDFPIAEQMKRSLQSGETVSFSDILGFETEVPSKEAVDKIDYAIERLTSSIHEEILRLNNQHPPKAVMLIGGGSLTPELPERLAKKLELPDNRIAIRGTEAIQKLTIEKHLTHAPTLVTPIGIAIASKQSPIQYKTVNVNSQPVRLFELTHLTAGDCLLAAGVKINKLYGKPGMALMINYNGQLLTIPGNYGKAPILQKNGQSCSLDEEVADGDELTVIKGEDGDQAAIQMIDLLEDASSITIMLDGQPKEVPISVKLNGEHSSLDAWLSDGDIIEASYPTVREFLQKEQKQDWLCQLAPFSVTINEKKTFFPALSAKLLINQKEAKLSQPLSEGAQLEIIPAPLQTVAAIAEAKQCIMEQTIPVKFNGEEIKLTKTLTAFYRNGEMLSAHQAVRAGDVLTVESEKMKPFIFQDLFRHVEVKMPAQGGGKFTLLKNGEKTTFYEPLQPGDQLEISWDS
ncbi:cell division protein FtsA [Bacillus ectoiniformans]|uniref:cell division protein FtsA n=1 Tax=Bacillus ectoiniformans TaxID=1494429 RepID=UPI001EF98CA1|nr:cell division protein FtsA [Bacillus ectoiniformans]MBM7649647.1 cell division protein FtsA [Bacillus ectoiniformans]